MMLRDGIKPFFFFPFAVEHLSDEYAKVNPFKRLPAIQDGDFTMTER